MGPTSINLCPRHLHAGFNCFSPELRIDVSPEEDSQPFRFLDLPKDIRIMIYEAMPVSRRQYSVPIQKKDNPVILVNTSIPGVHILATCRQVHEEASYILAPRLRQLLQKPPKIIIKAKELVGIHSLKITLVSACANLLDRISSILYRKSRINVIDQYRLGKVRAETLRWTLNLTSFVEKDDIEGLNAIASFVLHAAEYAKTKTDNAPFKYPHITIIIAVPTSFQPLIVTTTTSIPATLCYALRGRPWSRSATGPADLVWLLRRFAYYTSYTAVIWPVVSFNVKLVHVVDGTPDTTRKISSNGFKAAIVRGLQDAGHDGKGLLEYTGLVKKEEAYDLV